MFTRLWYVHGITPNGVPELALFQGIDAQAKADHFSVYGGGSEWQEAEVNYVDISHPTGVTLVFEHVEGSLSIQG